MRKHGITPFQSLEGRIDTEHARLVRKLVKECQLCGMPEVESCHIFGRSHYRTRWELPTDSESNVIAGCRRCHSRDHLEPGYFKHWFIRKWGMSAWDRLCRRANTRAEYSISDLQAILTKFREMLEAP